jgi:glycosyltransferase involved in cell wall biosynthesis
MSLTVVSLAYPIIPVGPDTVGGTEQVVAMLDDALTRAGHRSIVIAAEDSTIEGELVATPSNPSGQPLTPEDWERVYKIHRETLQRVLEREHVDLVHMHGVDFHTYPVPDEVPVLATLHLPKFNYPQELFPPKRKLTFLNCVSYMQRRRYPEETPMAVIPYGIRLDRYHPELAKEDFVLALGRIVPEKGFHLALDAAKEADLPLLLAGAVPPFPEHMEYFNREIKPRLDKYRRFIGAAPLAQRVDLIARARCLVVPSYMEETGPLVAMEALACGTPVVARPAGTLPERVEHGRTGFIVDGVDAMAMAMRHAGWLDPAECRRVACERFAFERMASNYIDLYHALAAVGRCVAMAA